MNIFWLDTDYRQAASYMTDIHVSSKMIVEAAQIIGEALQLRGYNMPYLRDGYETHSLTQWAAESWQNARETAKMATAMYQEKQYRYGGGHKSYEQGIKPISWDKVHFNDSVGLTQPPLCVKQKEFGERYVHDNIIESYRDYYANEKVDNETSWTSRPRPEWVDEYKRCEVISND